MTKPIVMTKEEALEIFHAVCDFLDIPPVGTHVENGSSRDPCGSAYRFFADDFDDVATVHVDVWTESRDSEDDHSVTVRMTWYGRGSIDPLTAIVVGDRLQEAARLAARASVFAREATLSLPTRRRMRAQKARDEARQAADVEASS